MRRDGWDGRLIVTCAFETEWVERWRLVGSQPSGRGSVSCPRCQRKRVRRASPWRCHAAREHGLTCQLSALPHGAAARTTVCMFGSLKPSDRSSGLRSFGLSDADHSESCPVRVLCSNDSYASKQVKRSPFSAWKCLRAGQQHSLPPHTRRPSVVTSHTAWPTGPKRN